VAPIGVTDQVKYPVAMRFEKWQGTGNHHIVVERDLLGCEMTPDRAIELCNTEFGIGADGVLELSFEIDVPRMTLWNADGSQAENCGNGIRIVAAYLARDGRLPEDGLVLTGAERTHVRILGDGLVQVRMGRALLPNGPRATALSTSAGPIAFIEVSMGNPHAVVQDADPDVRVAVLGPELEVHEHFPHRTNVEFVRTDGPSELTMRVWERGVGETLCCGTGACASAVAAVVAAGAVSPIHVHVAGGTLVIDVDDDLTVTMTGPVEHVYTGELSPGFAASLAGVY
jgi:diaminopimelate epimerase